MKSIHLFIACLIAPFHCAAAIPPSVVSLNVCADQLVLALADEEQILALSMLSHDPAASFYFEQARWHNVSDGSAESVLRLNPGLVIAGEYTTAYSVRLLQELGMRVEILPIADSVDSLFANIAQVGKWLMQQDRANEIISAFRHRLEALVQSNGSAPLAVYYDANGYTAGSRSLRGEILMLAGWENLAQRIGIEYYGSIALETLVMHRPDVIISSPYAPGTWSRAQQLIKHPVMQSKNEAWRRVNIPSRATLCAGPWTMDTIEQLSTLRVQVNDESIADDNAAAQ